MEARVAGREPLRKHVYLFVFGLQRFRELRQEEYAIGSTAQAAAETGERFAHVLREGPAHGVHALVWCDNVANLKRTFTRKTVGEFDMRVLFQMSVADSSELIEGPSANALGLHNAVLSVETEGSLEKFRPYMVPNAECMRDVEKALSSNQERR